MLVLFLWHSGGVVTPVRGATDSPAVSSTMASNRLTIAILGFENNTGVSSNAYWRFAAEKLIRTSLSEVKSLRILSGDEYALRQLNKKGGDPLDAADAGRAGRFIEARRVVWGSYQRRDNKWLVTAQVLNVATGKVSGDLSVASADWFEISNQLTEKILNECSLQPSTKERKKMYRRFTTSSVVLESLARARALGDENAPWSEVEKCVRGAVEADPHCAEAHLFLAGVLFNQGKLEEAEKTAHRALRLRSDYANAHLYLGTILALQGKYENAETSLLEAARLDPDSFENWERLGELRSTQGAQAQAIDYFNQALQLNPFSAKVHARIGALSVLQGRRDAALMELRKAEQLASPESVEDEQPLGEAFDALHELPSALDHYEKLVTAARKAGVNPTFVRGFEARWRELKDRLTLVYVVAAPPKAYTEETLAEILHQKLTADELTLVTNPLASTPEMNKWAHQLSAGATNDLGKAKLLFDALSRHVGEGPRGWRTAKETFADWNRPGVSFYCQEYAFLFVALSRVVGIKSYDVYVEEGCDGQTAPHACAAVFVAGKLLLVDPAYQWFGVPHKKFTLLDDLQAMALYLSYQKRELRSAQIAAKLEPDWALVRYNLCVSLASAGRWAEARQALPAPLRSDEPAWRWDFARARFALHDDQLDAAITFLQKAIKENPECGEAYISLGYAYWKQSKMENARANYRSALGCYLEEKDADQARNAIAQINESLGDSNPAGQPGPVDAADYVFRGDARARKGELAKAIGDYTKAIQLNPNSALAYIHRGYAYILQGNLDKALGDYNEAIRLDPGQVEAFAYRGGVYYQKREFDKALGDYNEAIRLNSQDAGLYNEFAWMLVNRPEVRIQNVINAVEAAKRACDLSEWKNSLFVGTLASAFAAVGDLEQAIHYQRKAISMRDATREDRKNMEEWLTYWESLRLSQKVPKPLSELRFETNLLTISGPQAAGDEIQTRLDISKLEQSAESGDAAAQARLAGYLYEGKSGLSTNRVQAYKWASVAASSGDKTASSLVKEFEIFMSPEEVSAGKAAAGTFLRQARKQKE
jgi:tetratricopeptide (TPR) repeat protein